VYVFAVIV